MNRLFCWPFLGRLISRHFLIGLSYKNSSNKVLGGLDERLHSETRRFMTIDLRSTKTEQKGLIPGWKETLIKYQRPALRQALWQLLNTMLPYGALWYLM